MIKIEMKYPKCGDALRGSVCIVAEGKDSTASGYLISLESHMEWHTRMIKDTITMSGLSGQAKRAAVWVMLYMYLRGDWRIRPDSQLYFHQIFIDFD